MTDKSALEETNAASKATRKKRVPNSPPQGMHLFTRTARDTNADLIHQELRRKIVAMEFKPGHPLSEVNLSKQYELSRTPVREALLRLAEERLVEVVPKSGTFVARIPLSALPDILVVRRALETVTVKAAARFATKSQIIMMRANIERQREVAEAGDEAAFHEADEEFHAAIAASGGHGGIWDLIHQVKVHIDRCRRLTLPQEGRMQMAMKEHEAILDAIEQENPQKATKCIEKHLDRFLVDIPQFCKQHPDYFVHDLDMESEFAERTLS